MTIKPVGRNELPRIRPLWEKLNAHHLSRSSRFKDQFAKLSFETRMETLERRDHFVAYVAEDGGEDAGYCIATVCGRDGEISSLFVDSACRGKGLGEALMSRALQWLDEHGCETIRLSIAEGNEDVSAFYRKFGFAERFVVMQRIPS